MWPSNVRSPVITPCTSESGSSTRSLQIKSKKVNTQDVFEPFLYLQRSQCKLGRKRWRQLVLSLSLQRGRVRQVLDRDSESSSCVWKTHYFTSWQSENSCDSRAPAKRANAKVVGVNGGASRSQVVLMEHVTIVVKGLVVTYHVVESRDWQDKKENKIKKYSPQALNVIAYKISLLYFENKL